MRALCSSVLVGEALVVFFALLVAVRLTEVATGTVLAVGGALAVLCLVAAGLLRYRWGYAAGWVIQALVVGCGFVVPAMFFLGALFAALWFVAIRLGSAAERRNGVETVGPPG